MSSVSCLGNCFPLLSASNPSSDSGALTCDKSLAVLSLTRSCIWPCTCALSRSCTCTCSEVRACTSTCSRSCSLSHSSTALASLSPAIPSPNNSTILRTRASSDLSLSLLFSFERFVPDDEITGELPTLMLMLRLSSERFGLD